MSIDALWIRTIIFSIDFEKPLPMIDTQVNIILLSNLIIFDRLWENNPKQGHRFQRFHQLLMTSKISEFARISLITKRFLRFLEKKISWYLSFLADLKNFSNYRDSNQSRNLTTKVSWINVKIHLFLIFKMFKMINLWNHIDKYISSDARFHTFITQLIN